MNALLESLFGRVGNPRQIAIVGVGVIATALIFGVSRWATQPTMVPLYADIPIENVKAMTDKLTESNIAFELDRTGTTIMVGSADLATARVKLAAEAMPSGGRPGLELFDKPSWGMTDFTQKVNYRRALEGELERTIGKLKNVEMVQVHLALEDDEMFKESERPSKASVTLKMAGGETPRAETVHGIASMVANSVGGLDPEHVTIVDERGQALTLDDEGSVAGLSSRQLAVQREVETYMEQKADKLLNSLVGVGNARVQVAASINFDKVERTVQAVDPERQAISSEQKSEVTPSSPTQGAGYTTGSTSYENTKSVESFSGAIGNVSKLTVAVLVADKVTMPVPDTTAGAVPSPIVTARTPDEIARIETLVRNALGVDSTRGDMISVVSAPFDMPAPLVPRDTVQPPQNIVATLQSNPKPVVAIAALLVLLVIALVSVSALKPKKVKAIVSEEPNLLPPATGYPELPASAQMQSALPSAEAFDEVDELEEEKRAVRLPPPQSSPEREQAMATVDQRPDAAIRVMRSWIRS